MKPLPRKPEYLNLLLRASTVYFSGPDQAEREHVVYCGRYTDWLASVEVSAVPAVHPRECGEMCVLCRNNRLLLGL